MMEMEILYIASKLKKHSVAPASIDKVRSLRTYTILALNCKCWDTLKEVYPNMINSIKEYLKSEGQVPVLCPTGEYGFESPRGFVKPLTKSDIPNIGLGALLHYRLEFPELEKYIQ